jgi:predicted nucleic acid-binding Zn ribbon protein
MEEKRCLECGEIIIGRSDKKFCSDYCRNAYNNKQNRVSNNLIRNVNNRLKKNWKILEELNPNDKTKVHVNKLKEKGFDFNLFTGIYTTKKQTVYYFVYNQGYLKTDNNYYILVKKQ